MSHVNGADTGTTFISDEAELREIFGEPGEGAVKKQLPALDKHAQAFLAKSPFMLLSTTGPDGLGDVSPRGDGPGFAVVLNEHQLALPDRPGNKRFDNFRNILTNPGIGMLFIVPGMEETLRVNGRARLVKDAPWFEQMITQGKRPILGILVDVEEVFFHCAKAFRRSHLWEPETWPNRTDLPTLGQILKDQVSYPGTAADLDRAAEEAYVKNLY